MEDKYKLLKQIAVVSKHETVNIKVNVANSLNGALDDDPNASQRDLLVLAARKLIHAGFIRGTYELGDVTITEEGRKVLSSLE